MQTVTIIDFVPLVLTRRYTDYVETHNGACSFELLTVDCGIILQTPR